ncbi:hypothetical protein BROUX41_001216 [Berkeleyomyces rouxiae]
MPSPAPTAVKAPLAPRPSASNSPVSPSPSPPSSKSSKSSKKAHKKSTHSSTAFVSHSLAQLAQHDLLCEWQYMSNQLALQRNKSDGLVRRMVSLQAQRDSGEVKKMRPVQRKIYLLQTHVHACTEQQNSLMARINQLDLEIRRRQLTFEEYHQRMWSTGAGYQVSMDGQPPMVPIPMPMYQQAAVFPGFGYPYAQAPPAVPVPAKVSRENISVISAASEQPEYQAREETPSLASDTCSDSATEQSAPTTALKIPSIKCISISSCPTSPRIVPEDKTEDTRLSPLTLDVPYAKKPRRQSFCGLASPENFFA